MIMLLLKSDQNGIEISDGPGLTGWGFRLKSDQNGIEIQVHPGNLLVLRSVLKSDQNGIEMRTAVLKYPSSSGMLKSDQNGIEIIYQLIIKGARYYVKIRPKWDWNAYLLWIFKKNVLWIKNVYKFV